MDWNDFAEEWDDIKETIFNKLRGDEEKYMKKYLNAFWDKKYDRAAKYKQVVRVAQSTLEQLESMSEEQLKRSIFMDYGYDDEEEEDDDEEYYEEDDE